MSKRHTHVAHKHKSHDEDSDKAPMRVHRSNHSGKDLRKRKGGNNPTGHNQYTPKRELAKHTSRQHKRSSGSKVHKTRHVAHRSKTTKKAGSKTVKRGRKKSKSGSKSRSR